MMKSTDIRLFPTPKRLKIISDNVTDMHRIRICENRMTREVIDDFMAFAASVGAESGDGVRIEFCDNPTLDEEEYRIEITDTVTVTASTVSGEIYALQTLKQLLFQFDCMVTHMVIEDKPEKPIRGFMLDCGRYFFSVDDVKLFIRRMAMHKLNLFHFHLTEDQGWRIEIDKYPLLTQIGSRRKRTNFNHTPHGGYYTKEDIGEIVRYAHAFGISVMPELDIPGHSRAAMACYSYLGCFNRKLPVADHWGVKHDVLCAGKESTYEFVQDIIDEMCELFPDKYFHIGGDEVPKHRWRLCPDCQQKIKDLGLPDEDALQCFFMNRIKDYCAEKGKQVFMWSWDLKDSTMLDNDLGFTKCGDLDTGNRPFIDTSTQAYYIDLPYGYISLDDSADHRLYEGNCLGAEATLWTEYVSDVKKADKMTYPRLIALCEACWCGKSNREHIADRLDLYYSFLDKNGIGYSKPRVANPSKVLGLIQGLWFEKRQLTWEGLTNIIDDKRVEALSKKAKEK